MATATAETHETDDETPAPLDEQLAFALAQLEEATRRLADHEEDRDRLRESRERVKRLEGQMLVAKETASAAKKAFETAMAEHLELEDELDSGQARLPLSDPEPVVAVAEPAELDESWRDTPIAKLAEFGLADSIIGKLEEASILIIADIAARPPGSPLKAIPGIGQAKADKISDALEAFWRDRGNAEILAGIQEAEAAKASRKAPMVTQDEPVDDYWRSITVGDLGLTEATVDLLDEHVIATAGELVAIQRLAPAWAGLAGYDIDAALTRLRGRLSNAQIVDFDAARHGEPAVAEGSIS